MGTKIPVTGIEEWKLHGVDDTAGRVGDTACQELCKACSEHGAQYFGYNQYAHSAHGNVNQG